MDRRALPAAARVEHWPGPDGLSIRRIDWRADDPAGSLLLMNGRGDFIEKYIEPLGHWHARGWNVVSFDWRGQGDSRGDVARGHVESFDPLIADGTALVQEWAETHPRPHVAIGHSMGAHLLLRIMAEHKPPLAAAVLIAPMLGINGGPVPDWMAQQGANWMRAWGWSASPIWPSGGRPEAPGFDVSTYLTHCPDRYADEMWWKAQQPGYELGVPTWGWFSAAYSSIAALSEERLRSITLPILIVATQSDRLVSARAIERAAQVLPNAELMWVDGAAHEILRESDAYRVPALARIDAFLDAHAR